MKGKIAKLIALNCLIISSALANFPANSSQDTFPYPDLGSYDWPVRVTGWGMSGDETFGLGDAMLRLFGNDQSMAYTDLQGKYSTDPNRDWFGAAGLGFRAINNNERILGAYVFADRNNFQQNNYGHHSFWFVSPGVESMGNLWDFRINAYFPVNEDYRVRKTLFADQVGIDDMVSFHGHLEFDPFVTVLFETSTGIGSDAEIGRAIPGFPNARAYLGGYYFSPKENVAIKGLAGRLLMPIDHTIAVEVADSYDNVFHNSIEAGLRFTIGGCSNDMNREDKDISRRMFDPISRNLSQLRQGTAEPIVTRKTVIHISNPTLENDNIWFFSPSGTPFNPANGFNNCTFEHPCNILDQLTIDGINTLAANADLFFDTGSYNNPNVGNGFHIPFGQSFFGRMNNFRDPATPPNLPLINDTLFLNGNNDIENLQIVGHSVSTEGTTVFTAIDVGSAATGTINLDNDIITAAVTGSSPASTVTALHTINTNATININQSALIASAQNVPTATSIVTVFKDTGGEIIINDSSLTSSAINNGPNGGPNVVFNGSTDGFIAINNSSLVSNLIGAPGTANAAIGIFNFGSMNITDSSILVNGNNPIAGAEADGIFNVGPLNLEGDSIEVNGNNMNAIGLNNIIATVNLSDTSIDANTTGVGTVNAVNNNAGMINDLGGNVCTENGNPASCTS